MNFGSVFLILYIFSGAKIILFIYITKKLSKKDNPNWIITMSCQLGLIDVGDKERTCHIKTLFLSTS